MTVAQGCATVTSHSEPSSDAEVSAEKLAEKALQAIVTGDVETIQKTVVTKDEFCSQVFPELPSSKVQNVTCDFVWDMARANHDAGVREVLWKHKGKKYVFDSVRFDGGSQKYPDFTVHKGPVVTVIDETGSKRDLILFGDVLEMTGRFKLFGYMVD